jgi:integrase
MLVEITEREVEAYQTARLKERAAGKTINDEIGVLFRVMGDSGDLIRLKLRKTKKLKLPQRQDVGRPLSPDEEARILTIARPGKRNTDTKSPVIYPAIVLGLNTAMRDSEMRHLTWGQIDFLKQVLTVGKSKTSAGTGRTIPLNSSVLGALADHMKWYEEKVGPATAESYVFPFGKARHYDAAKPMQTLKTAWRNVLRKAKVKIRLHDLRHTVITKLAESGASDETIMAIAGHVSRRMLSRYAHIRTEAKRRALEAVATSHRTAEPSLENDGHKNGHNAGVLSK